MDRGSIYSHGIKVSFIWNKCLIHRLLTKFKASRVSLSTQSKLIASINLHSIESTGIQIGIKLTRDFTSPLNSLHAALDLFNLVPASFNALGSALTGPSVTSPPLLITAQTHLGAALPPPHLKPAATAPTARLPSTPRLPLAPAHQPHARTDHVGAAHLLNYKHSSK